MPQTLNVEIALKTSYRSCRTYRKRRIEPQQGLQWEPHLTAGAVRSVMDKSEINLDEALNALSIPEAERQYFINAINNGLCG